MPVQANADGNVPFLPGRKRYQLVGNHPAWAYQKMAPAAVLNGARPRTATLDADHTDPSGVSGGYSEYTLLTQGGLFDLIGRYKRAIVVEAIDNAGAATLSLVKSSDGSPSRAVPTLPFVMSPHETFKATGGAAAGAIGIYVRLHNAGDSL